MRLKRKVFSMAENQKLFSTGDENLDLLLEEVYFSGVEDGAEFAQREFAKKSAAAKEYDKVMNDVAERTKRGLKDGESFGEKAKEGVKKAGKKAKEGAQKVGGAIKEAPSKFGKWIKETWNAEEAIKKMKGKEKEKFSEWLQNHQSEFGKVAPLEKLDRTIAKKGKLLKARNRALIIGVPVATAAAATTAAVVAKKAAAKKKAAAEEGEKKFAETDYEITKILEELHTPRRAELRLENAKDYREKRNENRANRREKRNEFWEDVRETNLENAKDAREKFNELIADSRREGLAAKAYRNLADRRREGFVAKSNKHLEKVRELKNANRADRREKRLEERENRREYKLRMHGR